MLNSHVPITTRKDLRVSPLVGEYIFVSQAGNRLQGDVSLKSNTVMLDTLAKGQGLLLSLSDPLQPYPLRSLIRDPNKILSPRAEVGVISKAKANSAGNPPKREKAVERKGRDVPDVRTPACMKAPEVPPLLVWASDQSPEKIAGRLSKFSVAWSEIGADPWVMRIVQWGYKIPFVTLPHWDFRDRRLWSHIQIEEWGFCLCGNQAARCVQGEPLSD